ncbi:hyperosmotically inducible protein [Paraburkholderia bannensis]|uniref:Hyperosmotically inducible protein n=1 Tax=Paraburkholderia bannensis TaxID=765414 RepID=A0A7W9WRD4_9BURK|nr:MULTISPECIES: BON domain-containing protein [Paraburkholderia]MBB3258067.1 hyperosmotically inducible protein [Paraburkholderia sp. WP4_3_2]MBB6103080.1 hyperosmotically inducible protein [Paraburkholderia bannensis]
MSIHTKSHAARRLVAVALCAAAALGVHSAYAQGGSEASAATATPAVAASPGADRALAANVRHALKAARKQGLKSSFIRVRARDGVVTLSGVVASQSQIDMATSVAQGVSGVRSVTTRLVIRDDEGIKGSQ